MQIEILNPADLTPAQVARWSALQAARPELASPFLSPHWALAVALAQGRRSRVKVAVLRDGTGEAARDVGFMAFKAGTLTAMPSGAPMCDYQALVSEPDLALDPVELVRALGVGRFDFCHMLDGQTAFLRHARGDQPSFSIDMPEGYEPYALARRAAGVTALKDIDKKRRKIEREVATPVFEAFPPIARPSNSCWPGNGNSGRPPARPMFWPRPGRGDWSKSCSTGGSRSLAGCCSP